MKRYIAYSIAILSVLSTQSCKEDPEDITEVIKEPVTLTLHQKYDGEDLEFNTVYQSAQNNDFWFTNSKFYLSNVIAVKTDGTKKLIADVALINFSPESESVTIQGDIEEGDYTAIEFDLGVRQDLNELDPATFDSDHPLSILNNMYWVWSTQYIFARTEGYNQEGANTTGFFLHIGTEDLYRTGVSVPRTFSVTTGGTGVSINFDMYTLLNQSDYTFDLVNDGQTHTTDNLPLAIHYMDNFTHAFN